MIFKGEMGVQSGLVGELLGDEHEEEDVARKA